MATVNPADEVAKKREWVFIYRRLRCKWFLEDTRRETLNVDGRWTLNPAVMHNSPGIQLCLMFLDRCDDAWEFIGFEMIRQFYYFM